MADVPLDWDIITPELKAAWLDGCKGHVIRMARPTPRSSVNRIHRSPWASVTDRAPTGTRTQTGRIFKYKLTRFSLCQNSSG